jgi:hypothetical protein
MSVMLANRSAVRSGLSRRPCSASAIEIARSPGSNGLRQPMPTPGGFCRIQSSICSKAAAANRPSPVISHA